MPFPRQSVYDPKNLDDLIEDVYKVSPEATGFSYNVQSLFPYGCQQVFFREPSWLY